MAINVTKPAINLREKLNEVTLETGIKGKELLNSDTSTEARNVLELDTHLFTDFESTGIDDNATSTAITIDASENVALSDGLTVGGQFRPYGATLPSIKSQSAASSNYFKLGSIYITGSDSAKIRIGGTAGYGNITTVSAETIIHLRANTSSSVLSGHFYTETSGAGSISGVSFVNTATDTFDVYVKPAAYQCLDTWVDTSGTWTPALLDSGSTSAPAGSFSIASSFGIAIAGNEKMRITSTGNVEVKTGNLVIGTSGKGIDFSANGNAAGMTSEVLDDYEEGTWTPAPTGSTSDPTVTAIAWRFGRYTKIGRIVTIEFYITMRTTVAGVGNIEISGLPFAPATDANRLQGQIMSGDAKENNATIISGDVYWATGTTTTFTLKKDSAIATWSGATGDWLGLSGSGSYAV